MESATWCRTPAAASAARRLRLEVSKNSSTALSSNEEELVRSITTCAPAMACASPSPVMLLTPLLGEAAMTSWPPRRRMGTVLEPMRPVPPMTMIFMVRTPLAEGAMLLPCHCKGIRDLELGTARTVLLSYANGHGRHHRDQRSIKKVRVGLRRAEGR